MLVHVIPLRRLPPHLPWLDYVVPEELVNQLIPGQLIRIPFRSGLEFGMVLSILPNKNSDTKNLKSISEVVVQRPLLSSAQLNFLQEMAELYATPVGFLVKGNLLPLKKRKIEKIKNQESRIKADDITRMSKPNLGIYQNLQEKRQLLTQSIPLDKQCLILVPELHDVEKIRTLITLEQRTRVVTITSETGEKDLFDWWLRVWQEPNVIVVSTRRALFLPFNNLQTIILDDEGNPAHKSWDMAPRFHTRDAALMLSHHHGAQLHILTHTPSVETYYFINKGVYHRTTIKVVHELLQHGFNIINLADERRGGNYKSLSEDVAEAVRQNISGITFLYLNRRGNLHYIACRDCGNVSKCIKCHASLTYYENKGQLLCHQCGHSETLAMTCKKCGGTSSLTYGAGTQQLYKEVKTIIGSNRNIIRLDSDDEKKFTLSEIEGNLAPPGTIVIGTQYAWARVPWKKISVMAFVDADTPLFVPEYKIIEELWHHLRDARFRLASTAQFFIQTSHPEHLLFQSLTMPERFYEKELENRKLFSYPPYYFLVKFFAGFTDKHFAKIQADHWHAELLRLTKDNSEVTISSPVPSFPAFAKGKFWYVILAKVSYANYKKWTKVLVSNMPAGWKVDPNPNSVLSV